MSVAVDVESIGKSFDANPALIDVSCSVARGRALGVLGHNGAGKTTLTRLISGVLRPDSGVIRVFGQDPVHNGGDVRRKLGVLPSSQLLDLRMTVMENLTFAAAMFGVEVAVASDRAADLLSRFELADRGDSRAGQLSAGMKQKASLARVLITDPQLLLLDEPTSALDPVAAREFRDHVRYLVAEQGRSAVLRTHDMDEAAELCDEVVILDRGAVIARGAPDELARGAAGSRTARIRTGTLPPLLPANLQADADGRITVASADDDTIATTVQTLVDAGIAVYDIERQHGTLEEFYLRLFAEHDHHRARAEEGQ